jgi:hypothetical protein
MDREEINREEQYQEQGQEIEEINKKEQNRKNPATPRKPRPKPHKYSVRVSSGLCVSKILAFLMTNLPREQPSYMNSMTVKFINTKSSEREFTFLSILSEEELVELMSSSNDPHIIQTFQPDNIQELVPKPRPYKCG